LSPGGTRKFHLNLDHFVVHPQPLEVNHEVDLKSFFQADSAGRPEEIGQVNALPVALVCAGDIFDPVGEKKTVSKIHSKIKNMFSLF
jgi:hypothetical protein